MSGAIDVSNNNINNCIVLDFDSRSSAPSNTNALYYYKSGSNYGFRTRMEGGNWSITQSAV
jgi:hypothetical protein